jgi:2,5-diamino-6-(ribosylamino)-4(3H)-pyrimidinone 5'-phosphate reductase
VIHGLNVTANFAISGDGKISSSDHRPSGWTSEHDHARLIELRKNADAIIVGKGTLQSDHMSLTVQQSARQPLRCVVSRRGNLHGDEKIFSTPGGPIHLLCTESIDHRWEGCAMHEGSLEKFLRTLHHDHHVKHVHCEGGGVLMRELLEIDCVNLLYLTWAAHTLFGGENAPTILGNHVNVFPATRHFALIDHSASPDSGEIFLTYSRQS